MTTYVLSFELNEDYNQDDLFEELAALGEAKQGLASTWFLKSEQTATEIRDSLSVHLAPDERLLVVKSSAPAAWRNLTCDNRWLIDNISNKN
ncbi:hypothetical protein NJC38_02365 [Pseudomonas sp. 21LCFQ010]|uniref:hypothetical protein n=1 Tax=Pseudomonas sp. 21LCFQ010 TaxID=2957506 RepID=UPI002096FD10|nr:hypothetical protein [Pseudomonas sp. 21LCFQ010]MCO8160995.1 hypothetical protein [Pseudomonas sp. 21LCFQ010]